MRRITASISQAASKKRCVLKNLSIKQICYSTTSCATTSNSASVKKIIKSQKRNFSSTTANCAAAPINHTTSSITKIPECQTLIPSLPPASAAPITDEEFEFEMEKLKVRVASRARISRGDKIAISLSGGSDSKALAILLKRWADRHGYQICAIVVDHALRPESAAETNHTVEWARSIGVDAFAVRLNWSEGLPSQGKVLATAREKRYSACFELMLQHNIKAICTAHHLNDNVETFLYRVVCLSGLQGLAGIGSVHKRGMHPLTLRPLLAFEKERLTATCVHYGQRWIEDPSNQNGVYARTRFRNMLPELEKHGITIPMITKVISNIQTLKNLLEVKLHDYFRYYVKTDPLYGFVAIQRKSFLALDPDFSPKVLEYAAQFVLNHKKQIRSSVMRYVTERLLVASKTASFSGCMVVPKANTLYLIRESNSKQVETMRYGDTILFDNRFRISIDQWDRWAIPNPSQAQLVAMEAKRPTGFKNTRIPGYNGFVDTDPNSVLKVKMIEDKDWLYMLHKQPQMKYMLKTVPHFMKLAVPGIYDEVGLLCVPHYAFKRCKDIAYKLSFDPAKDLLETENEHEQHKYSHFHAEMELLLQKWGKK